MSGSHRRGKETAIAAITAFKPRQVLLSWMKNTKENAAGHGSSLPPPPRDSKKILLQAICQYLERNEFFKSVKKLRSEAQIEVNSEKTKQLDLVEMYNEYLKIRHLSADDNKEKEQGKKHEKKKKKKETPDDSQRVITSEKADISLEEMEAKSKRTTKKEEVPICDDISFEVAEAQDEGKYTRNGYDKNKDMKALTKIKVSSKCEDSSKEQMQVESSGGVAREAEKDVTCISEGKKRKKQKEAPDYSEKEIKELRLENENSTVISVVGEEGRKDSSLGINSENAETTAIAKKSKLKRKRKKEEILISDNTTETEALEKEEHPKKGNLDTSVDHTEEMGSKKRKKLSSVEKQNGCAEAKLVDCCSDEVRVNGELKSAPLSISVDVEASKGENGKVSELHSSTPSNKDADGILSNNGDKSSTKKKSAKQRAGSAEPRTLTAFQRVKAEEIVFADERLQDNSYWAKDGADCGYGAKAQEILGQVKGRGFRHEKTKKKRGSYRGGQIDLQSHSVKFSYSDDD
ncbi:hypothetical protein Dimus_025667 [Dionaea muscipula]